MLKTKIRPLRFAALLCILATFPVRGQVENAADAEFADRAAQEQRALASLRRTPDPAVRPMRELRLVPSEPRIDAPTARVELAPPAAGVAPERAPVPPVVAEVPAPVAPRQPDGLAPELVNQRIAALAAVPASPPPVREARSMTAAEFAANWLAIAGDYLRTSWQQAGLAAFLVIAAGLLFWRLGERSRHAEPEPVAGGFEGEDEPAFGDAAPIEEDAVSAGDLSAGPGLIARGPAVPPIPPSHPQFATLRDALKAMKADDPARGGAVDA